MNVSPFGLNTNLFTKNLTNKSFSFYDKIKNKFMFGNLLFHFLRKIGFTLFR
jgi:hypothetical protein